MVLAARLTIFLGLPFLLAAVLSAQRITVSQPTIWASKPDAAAFDKIETDRLAAGQRAIDTLLAAKGLRTIEKISVPFDEAIRQNNSAAYFAQLMEQVDLDAVFRDHATAMLTKASAAQTAIALNRVVYAALAEPISPRPTPPLVTTSSASSSVPPRRRRAKTTLPAPASRN